MSDPFPKCLYEACKCFFQLDDAQLYGPKLSEVDPFWKVTPLDILQGTKALFEEQVPLQMPDCKTPPGSFWQYVDNMKGKVEVKTETLKGAPHRADVPRVVGFCGGMRHGKSTAADFLVSKYGYKEYAFAKPLKEGCGQIFNLNDSQLWGDQKEVVDEQWGVTPRYILQRVGTDLFRNMLSKYVPGIHLISTLWITNFVRWTYMHPQSNVVISDVRFADESKALADMKALLVQIKRPVLLSLKIFT
jgi:hypothetical protein